MIFFEGNRHRNAHWNVGNEAENSILEKMIFRIMKIIQNKTCRIFLCPKPKLWDNSWTARVRLCEIVPPTTYAWRQIRGQEESSNLIEFLIIFIN